VCAPPIWGPSASESSYLDGVMGVSRVSRVSWLSWVSRVAHRRVMKVCFGQNRVMGVVRLDGEAADVLVTGRVWHECEGVIHSRALLSRALAEVLMTCGVSERPRALSGRGGGRRRQPLCVWRIYTG
jgi:hypothetical protein